MEGGFGSLAFCRGEKFLGALWGGLDEFRGVFWGGLGEDGWIGGREGGF